MMPRLRAKNRTPAFVFSFLPVCEVFAPSFITVALNMPKSNRHSLFCCLFVVTWHLGLVTPAFSQKPKHHEDFFETKIRPALIKHCLECHSVDSEVSGGLLLDSPAGWKRGGDTGAAIEKGKPEASLLVKAIEYKDPLLQMPPDGRLPEQVVNDFRAWIRDGAIDPRPEIKPKKASTALPLERASEHWAYRPIQKPTIPKVSATENRDPNAIDALIQQSLDQAKLASTESASRAVLIRRLKFDLHGLPPTPDEIARFESDTSPDAYEQLVDSLLVSPRYAERMARRWLDVTRFAESLTLRGFIFDNAWRYRDYCIQGFAEDRPFDEMLREQIAGDLMSSDDLETRKRQVIATTFLLLGNTNLEEQDKQQLEMDFIDEQLDTIGKAILGQTIGCARCHDHKFDPIPTHDYYAMAGVLKSFQALEHSNVSTWIEAALPASKDEEEHFASIAKQISKLSKDIDQHRKLLTKLTTRSTPVVAVKDLPGIVVDDVDAKKIGNWQMSSHTSVYVGDGYLHDMNEQQGSKTVSFEPAKLPPGNYEVKLAYAPGPNRATNTRVSVFSADGEKHLSIDQKADPPIEGLWYSLGRYRFEKDGQAFIIVSNEDANGHVVADAVQFLSDASVSEVATNAAEASKKDPSNEVVSSKGAIAAELKRMESTKKELEGTLRQQPKSMALRPKDDASDIPIHIRGDVHNLGKIVPRGTLQLVSIPRIVQPQDRPFDRRDLAEWMVAPEQPLSARVLANRIWSWMMGEGLVRTIDNFGTTGEAPSHPELLDYLAKQLIDSRWSVRRLIREIVVSDAYRRASVSLTASEAADPDNRLLWRANRRRLDAESIRDTILFVSGKLKLEMYGRRMPDGLKADYGYAHNDDCRSLYVPVLRNAIQDVFEVFDMADPSAVVGKRNRSTVAPQALWMTNNPWIHSQSKHTAERLLHEVGGKYERVLEQASLRILGRKLTGAESLAIDAYCRENSSILSSASSSIDLETCTTVVHSLFQSLDFRFPE